MRNQQAAAAETAISGVTDNVHMKQLLGCSFHPGNVCLAGNPPAKQ